MPTGAYIEHGRRPHFPNLGAPHQPLFINEDYKPQKHPKSRSWRNLLFLSLELGSNQTMQKTIFDCNFVSI